MQTFLSESTFEASAAALDSKRLNKQFLEGRQMLNALAGNQKGFVNHPATNMWRGHEFWFLQYLGDVMMQMHLRGIDYHTNWDAIQVIYRDNFYMQGDHTPEPSWWTDPVQKEKVITTHRANLYKKDPEYYHNYLVDFIVYEQRLAIDPDLVVCCPDRRAGKQPCQYYWPTHMEEK